MKECKKCGQEFFDDVPDCACGSKKFIQITKPEIKPTKKPESEIDDDDLVAEKEFENQLNEFEEDKEVDRKFDKRRAIEVARRLARQKAQYRRHRGLTSSGTTNVFKKVSTTDVKSNPFNSVNRGFVGGFTPTTRRRRRNIR